jgi:hypothetical protein
MKTYVLQVNNEVIAKIPKERSIAKKLFDKMVARYQRESFSYLKCDTSHNEIEKWRFLLNAEEDNRILFTLTETNETYPV